MLLLYGHVVHKVGNDAKSTTKHRFDIAWRVSNSSDIDPWQLSNKLGRGVSLKRVLIPEVLDIVFLQFLHF